MPAPSRSKSPLNILSLPDELLLQITSTIHGPARSITLAALCLTCKRLCRIADGALYGDIRISIGREDRLIKTLRGRQDFKDRVLDVGGGCEVGIWFTGEKEREG